MDTACFVTCERSCLRALPSCKRSRDTVIRKEATPACDTETCTVNWLHSLRHCEPRDCLPQKVCRQMPLRRVSARGQRAGSLTGALLFLPVSAAERPRRRTEQRLMASLRTRSPERTLRAPGWRVDPMRVPLALRFRASSCVHGCHGHTVAAPFPVQIHGAAMKGCAGVIGKIARACDELEPAKRSIGGRVCQQ